MGKRGPRPTPIPILALRDSWRANPPWRKGEEPINAPHGPMRCPTWLKGIARTKWKDLVPQLTTMGVLARIDTTALERYCHLWARWRAAEEFLERYGETYPLRDHKGGAKCFMPHPQ